MSEDRMILAQRFAHALEQMRATWDLQYVGAGPVPSRARDEAAPEAAPASEAELEAAPVSEAELEAAPVSEAKLEAARASEPEPEVAPASEAEPEAAPASEAEPEAAPERLAPSPPADTPAPAPASESSRPAAPSTTEPPASDPAPAAPAGDPAQQAQAAEARKEALREQAQRWTPATKLEYLRRHNVGDCRRCPLSRTRTNIVFGVGNPEADVMFVGEAPGADEDRQGEPFVGRSGRLLDQWLEQLGMQRGDVYIANVLKCRPPGNRDPKPGEVDRCSPFLQAQIRAIEPKVIVALGRHAGMLLSRREDMTLRAMRSTSRLQYDAGAPKSDPTARIRIPLVVTYHPAYVLRQEGDGRHPPAGRPSPTEMVMKDLRRALSIAQATSADEPRH